MNRVTNMSHSIISEKQGKTLDVSISSIDHLVIDHILLATCISVNRRKSKYSSILCSNSSYITVTEAVVLVHFLVVDSRHEI